MTPARETSAFVRATTTIYLVRAGVGVRKNTTISKAVKKKSSIIVIRALERTAASYGLDLTNAIQLWSCLGGPSVVEDSDPDMAYQTNDHWKVEMRDGAFEEILNDSDKLDNADMSQTGSAPSGGSNWNNSGDAKDGLLNEEHRRLPAELSRRVSGIVEDEETASSRGHGGSGRGSGAKGLENYDSSSTHRPSGLSLTATKRLPTKSLELFDCCWSWPLFTASIRYFDRKTARSLHMNRYGQPHRCHFETCTGLASFLYVGKWSNGTNGPSKHVNYDEKRPDTKPPENDESSEGHLKVCHNPVSNHFLPENKYEVTTLRKDWRHAGSAPSREGYDRYDGGAQDRLFSGGCGRVPLGLSGRTGRGDGGDEDEDAEDSAGRGGGGGGGGDDGNDGNDSEDPTEEWPEISDPAERRRISNRIAQRNYRKKLRKRLQQLEMRCELLCDSSSQRFAEGGEVLQLNGARVRGQGQAHVDTRCFQRQDLDNRNKGMTSSKASTSKYRNGEKNDAIVNGGSAAVPRELIARAAGRDEEESDVTMGGSAGQDDENDSDHNGSP